MDSNRLITRAENYLKKINETCIDSDRLDDFEYFKEVYYRLDEQLNVLQDFKETMDVQGYTSPYRSLSKYGISTVGEVTAEEASETHRHNQIYRINASNKKNILDRVKSAITSHKIAMGNLEEYGLIQCNGCNKTYTIDELEEECSCGKTDYHFHLNPSGNHRVGIIPFLPLAGDYLVKISQFSKWGRKSFKKVINMLKQERKGSVKTVTLQIRYSENKKIVRKKVTLDSDFVDSYEEEIRRRFGRKVRIEKLQFHRTKPAIIDDNVTRTALAIAYVRQAEIIADRYKDELFKDNIKDLNKLKKYDEIIYNARIANPKYLDETDSIEEWREDKINNELIKAKLKYKNGFMNRTLDLDLKTRKRIENSVFVNLAPALILWDIFKYYLTSSLDKRKRYSGPFPYLRNEIDRQQRKIFEITYTKAIKLLNKQDNETIIPVKNMDLILHKKFNLEKKLKNSNLKVDYYALGAAIIYKEGNVDINLIAKSFNIEHSRIRDEVKNIEFITKPKSDKSRKFLDLIKT